MALLSRARNMMVRPVREWAVIAREPATEAAILEKYVAPMAAIAPVFAFLANLFIFHRSLLATLGLAVLAFLMEFPYVLVVASIADSLAKSWGAAPGPRQSVKLVAYAWTPRWLAGVFNLVPAIGSIAIPVATLYGFYLLYLGAVPLMQIPAERKLLYTLVVVIAGASVLVVIYVVLAVVYAILGHVALSLWNS